MLDEENLNFIASAIDDNQLKSYFGLMSKSRRQDFCIKGYAKLDMQPENKKTNHTSIIASKTYY